MRVVIAAAVLLCLTPAAWAQQWSMPGYNPLGDSGTIRELAPRGDGFFLSNKDVGWGVRILPGKTKVTVSGLGDPSFLKPKMYVRFNAEVDEEGAAKAPLKELEIYSPVGKVIPGFYMSSEPTSRPVTKLTAGKYEVRSPIIDFADGALSVTITQKQLKYDVASDAKIKVNMPDIRYAQPGDKVTIVAWYQSATGPDFKNNRPGSCIAEKVTITAAAPIQPIGPAKK